MNKHLIDTSILVEAHRRHYPFDVVPSFWNSILGIKNDGNIVSIDKVFQEIKNGGDDLLDWCRTRLPQDFFLDSSVSVSEFQQISQWINNSDYKEEAKRKFLNDSVADIWLIAYAKKNGYTIVTEEISTPQSKKKIKIPDVCAQFGIPCINTIDMYRGLGKHF